MDKRINEKTGIQVEGHLRVINDDLGIDLVNKRNAIHAENFSVALANLLANLTTGDGETGFSFGFEDIVFGDGGVVVDGIGGMTFRPTNTRNVTSQLYNQLYAGKISFTSDESPDTNISTTHVGGTLYTDVISTLTLDYTTPHSEFDDPNADFIFDEIGIRNKAGFLMTHVVFNPVVKTTEFKMRVVYTIRITVGNS